MEFLTEQELVSAFEGMSIHSKEIIQSTYANYDLLNNIISHVIDHGQLNSKNIFIIAMMYADEITRGAKQPLSRRSDSDDKTKREFSELINLHWKYAHDWAIMMILRDM